MLLTKKISFFLVLSIIIFFSSIFLVNLTYEFRVSFSQIEELNKLEEDLSFKSNLLLNEVEHFRNQLTIRKIATKTLGMRPPQAAEQVLVFSKELHQ